MRLLITFARDYPWQSAVMLGALLFAGIAEGVSLTALLPLLSFTMGNQSGDVSDNGDNMADTVADALATLGITPTINVLLVIIVGSIILKSGLLLIARKRVGYAVAHVTTTLRLALLRAMLATRWEYYLRQRAGRLANAMASEAIRASQAFVHGSMAITLFIQAVIYAIIAFLVSWQATLVCLGSGALILLVLHFLVKMSRKAGKRQTKLLKSLLARLTDTLQSVKPLKAMARENLADAILSAETKQLNRALQREVFSREMLKALQEPMFTIVVAFGIFVSIVYWSLPLAEVMVLVLLLFRLLSSLGKVQREYQKMVSCEAAFWSLERAISDAELEREPLEGTQTPSLNEAISFNRIGFTYGENRVLKELSLTVPAGALTTLVGPSGAGKTTIIDLVTGLLKPQEGQILIDNMPLESLDLRRWRQLIGYVPQENLLLHDTVLNNVTLGDPELTEADAQCALQAAGAWDFVAALQNSLHEIVGERGAKLSGGQRQRIMIARALVHRPRLLILDEATSALDPDSEAAICNTLEKLRGELTVLAISHQPALVEAADRVYRLEQGTASLMTERPTVVAAV